MPFHSMIVLLAHNRDTSVRRIADHVLELNRRVTDFEFPPQAVVDRAQNRIAFGGGYVCDFNVGRERVIF